MMSPQRTVHGLWRWYWALFTLNALDLLLTNIAVHRGMQETNRFLQPIIMTPWPIVLKFAVLIVLAAGLLFVTHAGRRPRRMMRMIRVCAVFYLGVLVFHLLGLARIG